MYGTILNKAVTLSKYMKLNESSKALELSGRYVQSIGTFKKIWFNFIYFYRVTACARYKFSVDIKSFSNNLVPTVFSNGSKGATGRCLVRNSFAGPNMSDGIFDRVLMITVLLHWCLLDTFKGKGKPKY